MTARIFEIVAEYDTAGARRLGAANNPGAGVVVVAVPPDLRRGYELGWELLAAYGARDDVAGTGRNHEQNWDLVVAWTLAHAITDLVVLDAQWLTDELAGDLAGLAAIADLTLWLVAPVPVSDRYAEALKPWPVHPGDPKRLAAALPSPPEPARAPTAFPRVPRDNWTTWLAAARRHLPQSEAATVEARYRMAFDAAVEHLGCADAVDEDAALGHVRSELARCADAEEMLTVTRAVQAAAFRSGWLLHADLPRLLATADTASRAAVTNPANFAALAAYREPYRAVACALAALDLSTDQMTGLTVDDAAVDGTTLTVNGTPTPMPAGTSAYLRAQVTLRLLEGAAPTDALLASSGGPYRDRTLVNAVRAAIGDVGVPFTSQTLTRAVVDHRRWTHRWGLALQEL